VRKKIKLCILGAGRVGMNNSRFIAQHIPDANIVAVVDPFTEIRREIPAEFGIENEFDNIEQALGNVQFDGVIITTPTPTHQALACMAAENGKHIFLEKPKVLNLVEYN
jgi:myo-inositol 2-dehydrogenase / D-chiro-inositol 1-dehydrogenase